jgi:hypothetical protein
LMTSSCFMLFNPQWLTGEYNILLLVNKPVSK